MIGGPESLDFDFLSSRICRGCLNGFCGSTDYIDHAFRLGEHWHVAALKLIGCRTHALRCEAFEFGMDGAVVFANNVPARLRSPGGAFNPMVEDVRGRREVRGPDDLLLLLRQVSGEALDAFRKHPGLPLRRRRKHLFWGTCPADSATFRRHPGQVRRY